MFWRRSKELCLYIVRGLPDSGKTTLAHELCELVYSADDLVYKLAEQKQSTYADVWSPAVTAAGHDLCKKNVQTALAQNKSCAVANTFTTRKEMAPYIAFARKYNAKLVVITVERNPLMTTTNNHGVPPDTIRRMHRRWQWLDPRTWSR